MDLYKKAKVSRNVSKLQPKDGCYYLIKYENGDLCVTPSTSVSLKNASECVAKVKGGRYAARIIKISDKKQDLIECKHKLMNIVPLTSSEKEKEINNSVESSKVLRSLRSTTRNNLRDRNKKPFQKNKQSTNGLNNSASTNLRLSSEEPVSSPVALFVENNTKKKLLSDFCANITSSCSVSFVTIPLEPELYLSSISKKPDLHQTAAIINTKSECYKKSTSRICNTNPESQINTEITEKYTVNCVENFERNDVSNITSMQFFVQDSNLTLQAQTTPDVNNSNISLNSASPVISCASTYIITPNVSPYSNALATIVDEHTESEYNTSPKFGSSSTPNVSNVSPPQIPIESDRTFSVATPNTSNFSATCIKTDKTPIFHSNESDSVPSPTLAIVDPLFHIVGKTSAINLDHLKGKNDFLKPRNPVISRPSFTESMLNSTKETTISNNNTVSEYFPESTADTTNANISDNSLTHQEQSVEIIENPVELPKITVPHRNAISKKHFCIYCKSLQTKIARHLYLKHKSEKLVKEALQLPTKSKERFVIIDKLRKEGDFLHNTSTDHNSGILIVSRQQQINKKNTADDYSCCHVCKGFYSKVTLRKHLRRCNKSNEKNSRYNLVNARKLTQSIHKLANPTLRKDIFPVFVSDEVAKVLRYDELVIIYANKLTEKYTLSHQTDLIRSELRLLGRFLLELKSLDSNITQLKDIFKPRLFDTCVKALRKTAKWDDTLKWFRTPAVATHLTTLVKKIGKTQQAELIKTQSEEAIKELKYFLDLWEEDIRVINKKALEDQITQKRTKKQKFPSLRDIKKLYVFLKNKIFDAIAVLDKKFSLQLWKELVKSTLTFIQIFNRRRAGEIERLTIDNYLNKDSILETIGSDVLGKVSQESVAFAKQYVRLTMRGKLGRTVSVLLSPLCTKAIDLIIKYRSDAEISNNNKYIFAKFITSKFAKPYYRACTLLKKFSEECGAEIPSSLRGTSLRKHIATYTSLLNVEDATVDKLANFMGHNKDIHKSIYRLSVPVAEVTCVSKILTAAVGDGEESDNDVQHCNKSNPQRNITANQSTISNPNTSSNLVISSSSNTSSFLNTSSSSRKIRSTSPYGKTKRQQWTQQERDAIFANFGDIKHLKKLPSMMECVNAINSQIALRNRTPQQVKSWIDNQIRYK